MPALLSPKCTCTEAVPFLVGTAQVVPNFRIRTIPVLGTTPAIFGLAAAAYVLCQLAGQPFVSEPHFRVQVDRRCCCCVPCVCA